MRKTTALAKPSKPHPDFPLFAHSRGYWCKKIKGKQWNFGPWDDPDAALRQYLDWKDQILAGRDPRVSEVIGSCDGVTLVEVVNLFLAQQEIRSDKGDIAKSEFRDLKLTGKRMVQFFGRSFEVNALRAADFTALRNSFPSDWAANTLTGHIRRTKTIFKWAAESEIIDHIPNFGRDFKRPSKSLARREKAHKESVNGKMMFQVKEARQLIIRSDGWLKACILLGLNAGFGASDCSRLRVGNIDADGFYDIPRFKTGVPRRFKAWPETVQAIEKLRKDRPVAASDEGDDLCFLTSHGKPVWWETENGTRCDNVGRAFQKLIKALDKDDSVDGQFSRPGRSFYSLRRTFETIAGGLQDQPAVDLVMGHLDGSMAATYRQEIEDSRVEAVCVYVRQWLFEGSP